MAQSNGEIEQMIMTRFGMDLTEDWYDSFRYEDRVMLRDWIIADRKQHELEAREHELKALEQSIIANESLKKMQIRIKGRIAELKSERERLGK